MAKILISDPLHPDAIAWLQQQPGAHVVVQPEISHDELLRTISEYDALIVRSRTKVTKEVIAAAKKLRVIGRAGTGLDNIDVEAAQRAKITVLNAPGANANAVAELTLGLMLALARNLPDFVWSEALTPQPLSRSHLRERGAVRRGEGQKPYGIELAGKTLGLIGYGRIGRIVAHLALAFGMKVLAYDIVTPERVEPGVRFVPLKTLLSESDFVSIHVPLTQETRGLVNAKLLESFKAGSFLLNTARAEIVDEHAVFSALQSGKLRGYAADLHTENS
ncbi:MAG: hydroxyacid dehydrogenase, partial [Candidatus Bipolaricaulia bacterium]